MILFSLKVSCKLLAAMVVLNKNFGNACSWTNC